MGEGKPRRCGTIATPTITTSGARGDPRALWVTIAAMSSWAKPVDRACWGLTGAVSRARGRRRGGHFVGPIRSSTIMSTVIGRTSSPLPFAMTREIWKRSSDTVKRETAPSSICPIRQPDGHLVEGPPTSCPSWRPCRRPPSSSSSTRALWRRAARRCPLPGFDVSRPNVVRMRTFSKAYGLAGLRCGYAVGHEDTIRFFDKVRNHYGMNRMAQAAGARGNRRPGLSGRYRRPHGGQAAPASLKSPPGTACNRCPRPPISSPSIAVVMRPSRSR